jgi:quinol monooxygenase YgiN
MIIVTGMVVTRPDSFDEILRLSTEHVLRSRKEPGCLSHSVHRDTEDPLRLHFFERWQDRAALKPFRFSRIKGLRRRARAAWGRAAVDDPICGRRTAP